MFKKYLPSAVQRQLYRMRLKRSFHPPVGKIQKGDFERLLPFSTEFGYDRGGPVDRFFIERFLEQSGSVIQGRVLEIGDNEYTLKFGKHVTQSDILHVDASNKKATFIGDIAAAPHIPDAIFDCIILTQTLHLIYDFRSAIQTCFRILKPGGALLLTVPGITPIDHGEWKETWYWSFTQKAMERLMKDHFGSSNIGVNCFGNVQLATAFLYGLGISEVTKEALSFTDPHYPLIITVKAIKTM